MDTVIVASSQFYSHYPKRIPQGTVNAEAVLIRLDSEWDNLTVRIHWLNVASGVEKVVLLERDQPNTIPWEVLTELGELRMGLDGMDGGTIVKPTVWLTYGYVVDGVDPEAGDDPQPPTPSWEQQMVEQAKAAAAAAEASKDAAEKAGEAAGAAAPYAEEAKKSAEAAKESQEAADTSAKQAANAKDQANIASDTAKDHADAAGTAKVEAERAAEMAGNAQSGAAQSAQASANSAKASETAKQEAQKAASIFPQITQEDAGKFLAADLDGKKLEFVPAPGGGGVVVVDFGPQQSGVAFDITQEQMTALVAKSPPVVAVELSGMKVNLYRFDSHQQGSFFCNTMYHSGRKYFVSMESSGTRVTVTNTEEPAVPSAEGVMDGYVLTTKDGVPVWGRPIQETEFEKVAEITTEVPTTAVNVTLPFTLTACRVSVTIPPEPSGAKTRNLYLGEKISTVDCLCRTQSYSSSTSSEIVYDFLVIRKHKRWLGLSLARSASFYQQVPIYTVSNGLCLADAASPLESLSVFTYGDALPEGTTVYVEGVKYGS